jgi:peptide/nickel transport system permease protein
LQSADEVERVESSIVGVARARELLHLIRKNTGALIGGILVFIFLVIAIVEGISGYLGKPLTPYNPIQTHVGPNFSPPTLHYLMGTDNFGRDVFSRVIASIPNDAVISFSVIAVALVVGLFIGSFAAFRGGILEEALMRITDVFFAIPALILAIAIAVALGPGLLNMMIALMIIWWPPYARLARGEALKVSHQNFIEASRFAGLPAPKIVLRHVIPNISITLLVYATLDIGTVILVYSGLSYFGLGVLPPAPDLGRMVSEYADYVLTYYWLPLFPGLTIALLVISYSIFGDGLRDALEVG